MKKLLRCEQCNWIGLESDLINSGCEDRIIYVCPKCHSDECSNFSEDDLNDEIEKCRTDPVYFYNTYWVLADGTKPNTITQEQWDELIKYDQK